MKQEELKDPKYPALQFKVGDDVYINAFLKSEKGKFYVCVCTIEEVPQPNQRRIYKVRITAVSDKAIGSKVSTPAQAALLGRTITKRENELTTQLPEFMAPDAWIILDPQ